MTEPSLNESETRAELIDPALKAAGWGVVDASRVRREVIAPGRLQGGGRRAQAKRYAERLQARFAYSTNGDGIYRVDLATGKEGLVYGYPSPEELWAETFSEQNAWRERFGVVPFEDKGGLWEPRYYQHNAINQVLESVAAGDDRVLLTMVT